MEKIKNIKLKGHGSFYLRDGWLEKAINEIEKGNCKKAVFLIPARTDTKWFHDLIYNKYDIQFIKGRLKFGDSKNSAPFPSMFVWLKIK